MSTVAEWVHGVKKALGGWDPSKHPRGRDGKFLEVGDLVGIYTGPNSPQVGTGRVVAGHYASDGRFFVAVEDINTKNVGWYRPKQIEQINPKADLTPTTPIPDVGSKEAVVPWKWEWAAEANKHAKGAVQALDESVGSANIDQLGATMATTSTDTPIGAGLKSAAEIAKKQGKIKAIADSPSEWLKSQAAVPETAPAPENVLKAPLQLTGTEWSELWYILDDATPEAAGMGFSANGLDLSVTDYASAKAVVESVLGAVGDEAVSSPAMMSVLAKLQDAYKHEHPGKPEPSLTPAPAKPTPAPGPMTPAKIQLTGDQIYVFEQFEDFTDGEPFGISKVGDEYQVYDQHLALAKLEQHKIDQENMDIYDPAVTNLIAKVKAAVPTPSAAPVKTPTGVTAAPIKLPKGKTPADLVNAITTSAANKFGADSMEYWSVKAAVDSALDHQADHKTAHKYLALAMTKAKLGGKQRARYKQLLDMHHGVSPIIPQSPPATGPGAAKSMVPSAPAGGKSLALTQGNTWVNPGTLTPQQAKARIQRAISDRLKDVDISEFHKVLVDSPGMGTESVHATTMANLISAKPEAIKVLAQSKYLVRKNGSWQLVPGELPGGVSQDRMELTRANLETAIRQTAVNALIGTWAATSNDNSPRSLALQELAVEEFDLDPAWIYNWHSQPSQLTEHKKVHRDLYRRFLREMYNNTQAEFKKTGVTHVRLRRGVHSPPTQKDWGTQLAGPGKTGSIVQRPMSSYSSNTPTAKSFGSYVHEAYVPVERIIGSALTGFGCQHEYEYVVLGGPNEVKVVYG